jgi:membrane protein implicated in regulation of membrane protease activity
MSILSSLDAIWIFLAVGLVGFIFLIVSAVFGEIFEHVDGLDDHGGPGLFSTRVMAVFITAFGGSGAVATYYGAPPMPAAGAGLVTGVIFGGAIYCFARFLYGQQASSDVRANDLVGQIARVVVAIPAGGVGQIRCRVGEELVDKIARTRDGVPLGENVSVQVEDVIGETVIVKRQ